MTKLNTYIEKEFIDKIEEALVLSTSNLSTKFLLYDIWEYDKDPYPETHQTQYKYFEKLFYGDLEVIGGAFSVLEKYANVPLLLFRKNRNHSGDVKESDFFWFPYEVKYYTKESATLIDTTFLSTRESQRLDESGPDFLRYINEILKSKEYEYKKLTNGITMHNALPVIYCDSAEIITLCFCYIIILEKYQNANSGSANIFSENHIELLSFDSNEGNDVLDYILKRNSDTFFNSFLNRIGKLPDTFFKRNDISENSTIENIKEKIEDIITQDFKITNFLKYEESIGLIHEYARFPIIPYILIYWYKNDRIDENIFPCHLVFPVWNSYVFQPDIKLNKEIVSEGKVIFALLTVNDNFYFNSNNNSDNNFSILSRIIHKLGYIISDTVFYNKFAKKSIQNQATRAAISQVMARNMSHNIGSHVMNALITDNYLENFKVSEPKSYKANIELEDKDTSNFNQLRIYNNYVKTRMDYLADITFGTPVMLITKMAYAHIFCELDRVRLLLDNISGRGDQFKYSLQFVDAKNRLLSQENDIPLAIPNDVLGCQAFYNIIENVIRNTAKHANSSGGQKLFTVRIKDGAEFDWSENSNTKEDLKEYYAVEIFDDIEFSKDSDIIRKQNIKLNEKILNNNNELRSESLGLVEMDASAAYLRQLDIVSINIDEYDVDEDNKCLNPYGNINILKAFNAGTNEIPKLGYRFFIKKPQEVLVITEDVVSEAQNDLSKNGITLLSQNEFKFALQNGKIFNHQFLVVDDSLEIVKKLIFEHSGSLPLRIYYKLKDEICELLSDHDTIESKIWQCREIELKDYSKKNKYDLNIYTRPIFNNCQGKCESSFESHLYNLKENAEKNSSTIEDEWKINCKTKFYHEALSSKAESYLPNNTFKKLSEYLSSLSNPAFYVPKTKIAESILSRIIVIDERIQEILEKQLFDISYNEHFKMSNIYLPPININLKGDSIRIEEVNGFIDDKMNNGNNNIPFDFNPKFDFILIHYSILERAWVSLSEDEKNITPRKDWINSWLEKYKNKATIVVTSGRGNVKDLPNHVRFTNLSSVTTALKEIKSKYLTHQIIYASRTTK